MTPSQALAGVLVDELARCGVRHVVLSPGSRSAPLAYALLAADRAGRLRLHVRVDERSAAFLALGLARGRGAPAAVVTTSGTAVANLHPAVLEADEAGVPLLLLTADRPPELRGTRANQTTDQVGIFGRAVRWTHDLGAPERRPGQQAACRTAVDRAMAAASGSLGGEPGPVQLNVPLRDPLAPEATGASARHDWPESLDGRPGGSPWTALPPRAAPGATAPHAIERIERTLVVLGDLGDVDGTRTRAAIATARRLGWPVVGEPFGTGDRAGVVPHGPLVLGVPGLLEASAAQRILVLGRVTLSRATAGLLRTPGARVEAVTDSPRWPDPAHVLHAVHPWSAWQALAERSTATGAAESSSVHPSDFLLRWGEAGERLCEVVTQLLERDWSPQETGNPLPTGPALAHAVLDALPPHACLFVGSSNSARDVETARGRSGPVVVANRGLAGIDGCLSTAAGLALARPEVPHYALVGDLTFLHDANALLVGPTEPMPDLTIVVADDAGGGIFATLEYGEPHRRADDAAGFERVFATPTGTDLAALCRAHGVAYERVTERDRLRQALSVAPRGLWVVHVPIRRTHREGAAVLAGLAEQLRP